MTRQEILRLLTEVFSDVLDVNVVLKESATTRDIPMWDSLNHVQLMIAVERKFGISFTARDIEFLKSISDLISLIQKKQKNGFY